MSSAGKISPSLPEKTPYQLGPFEAASGYVGGADEGVAVLRAGAHEGMKPLEALESAVLPALLRPPCLVVFSGGRDSSAVLAVATSVARRNGLAVPVPATNRFPAAHAAEESEWQELVVRHLGLSDWHIRNWDGELDVVGPVAQTVLRRWGAVYPHNAHFALPLLEAARGGSALTGIGGDQVFTAAAKLHVAQLLCREVPPRRGDWRAFAAAAAPRRLRQALWQRHSSGAPWLTPRANARLAARLAADAASTPLWFSDLVRRQLWRQRTRTAIELTLAALVGDLDVEMFHPLQSAAFLSAVAAAKPRTGYPSRDAAMTELFSALLPAPLLQRETKAGFNEAFFHEPSRSFVRQWDGSGLDPSFVDPNELRRVFSTPRVDARAFSALQAAWAAQSGRSTAAS
jgi:asparagine synthetase B (glutamine-hydrolysing)